MNRSSGQPQPMAGLCGRVVICTGAIGDRRFLRSLTATSASRLLWSLARPGGILCLSKAEALAPRHKRAILWYWPSTRATRPSATRAARASETVAARSFT